MSNKYTTGRVERLPQSGITSDRYEFLGLEQAEPDLGDPNVGVSSVGTNPFIRGNTVPVQHYVLIAADGYEGERFWVPSLDIATQGIQGIQGTQGNQGNQGVQGLQGRVGDTIIVIGNVADVNATGDPQTLLSTSFPSASPGNAVIDDTTNNFWIYQGSGNWINIGNITIQGIQGNQGLQGSGTQGLQGLQGNQGNQGLQGNQGN